MGTPLILTYAQIHPFLSFLTILRFQFGASLCSQQADHEAVVFLGAAAGLCGCWWDNRGHQGSADDGVCSRRGGLPCGGQVLLFWVHVHRVQTDLSCASGLSLILHSYGGTGIECSILYGDSLVFTHGPTFLPFASLLTTFVHASLEAPRQSAGLALVAMRLVNRAHAGSRLTPTTLA